MDNTVTDEIKECLDILDESSKILVDLEFDLNEENKDELIPDMKLYQLYDMAEDVVESSKIKRAESNLLRRQTANS